MADFYVRWIFVLCKEVLLFVSYFFTIHYYILPPKNPVELVKSEKVKIPHFRRVLVRQ